MIFPERQIWIDWRRLVEYCYAFHLCGDSPKTQERPDPKYVFYSLLSP